VESGAGVVNLEVEKAGKKRVKSGMEVGKKLVGSGMEAM